MNVTDIISGVLSKGGPAAAIVCLLALIGVFDLPFPGDQPGYIYVVKPILALVGAASADAYRPPERGRQVLYLIADLSLFLVSLSAYRYFSNTPATLDTVNLHWYGSWVSLGAAYFFFGSVSRVVTVFVSTDARATGGPTHAP